MNEPKRDYVTIWDIKLPQEIRTYTYECPGSPPGGPFTLEGRYHTFKRRLEGTVWIDDEFSNFWVQYL